MKQLKFPLITFLLLSFVFSCQKEVSFENGQNASQLAQGSLKAGITGDCAPMTVAGTYRAGNNLGPDTNYIDVEVNITQTGSYTISTDTVNGYSFRATGVFNSTGTNQVRLKGNGRPVAAGIDDFIVSFDSTFCFVSVTVLPVIPQGPGTAVYSLSGSPNACAGFTPQGTYKKNTALTAANTVTVQVNVTTAGTYNITTNTVNGMSFSGSGTFTGTGLQNVVLNGSGTPVNAGASNFTVTAGTSTCTFSITVQDTAPPAVAGDTIKRVNNASATNAGNTYRVFEEFDHTGMSQWEYYFRKSGNDFLEYAEVHNYSILTFDNTVEGDILFLKEGATTGTTWNSAVYSGTVNGTAAHLRYTFTLTDANGTATINGKNFTEVYKITWKSQTAPAATGPWTDEGLVWESWYAKNIGLIYQKGTFGANSIEYKIRNWQVF
jgi:hypothetical protein